MNPIANFGQVSPLLWRGAEPDEDGIAFLVGKEIETVVDLESSDEESVHEQRLVHAAGMGYVQLPWDPLFMPDDNLVAQFLWGVKLGNRKMFVHCREGRDRTGVMVAAYRITFDGWSAERAIHEAEQFHMHWYYFLWRSWLWHFPPKLKRPPFKGLV